MANQPALTCSVNITSKSINNDSVASVFNNVKQIEFNYSRNVVRILDADQGEFFFGISLVTTVTYTVTATSTAIVIS